MLRICSPGRRLRRRQDAEKKPDQKSDKKVKESTPVKTELLQGQGRLQDGRQRLQAKTLARVRAVAANRRLQDARYARRKRSLPTKHSTSDGFPVGGLVKIAGPPSSLLSEKENAANRFNGFSEYGSGLVCAHRTTITF